MQAILSVTIPFFALVLCGYLAAHRHVLPESAIPGLNTFVLYFALPSLLFRFGSGTPIFDLLNPVVDLDRDLGLHGAIDVQGLRLEHNVLRVWGAARIPKRPE